MNQHTPSKLESFRDQVAAAGIDALREGLIGNGAEFETPFGVRNLLYADYVASGRALRQVEDFVAEHVLPFYANSHTEASFCGQQMTRIRGESRDIIAGLTNCTPDCSVVFTGSGATAGLNRIVGLLNLAGRVLNGEQVVVLIGPYEHHSNMLPWRESGADVRELPEGAHGGVDLQAMEEALIQSKKADLIVGSFSAASNVTGIITDPDPVCRLLKKHGALSIWDYAGGGPYLPMDMNPGQDCAKDAIVFSPHKFPGGPGASGVMILRDAIVCRDTPTAPGGGTVSFVSPWEHTYSDNVATREEGGTPNVIGDIRAALAMLVKDAIGNEFIHARDNALRQRLLTAWKNAPGIELLGQKPGAEALPIFSFMVRDGNQELVHYQLFTRMLSDYCGIQVRGGCACAGSYGHRLLDLDREKSDALFRRLQDGEETEKPGWVRLNLSYLHSEDEVERIIREVPALAAKVCTLVQAYESDPSTARLKAICREPETEVA